MKNNTPKNISNPAALSLLIASAMALPTYVGAQEDTTPLEEAAPIEDAISTEEATPTEAEVSTEESFPTEAEASTEEAVSIDEAVPTEEAPIDEEVLVTGFRNSILRSLEAKKEATNFTESILATDVAEFPDTNLAEAMQRVPGVTITRDAGEGRQVSMRGLGPDFTKVTINGMDGLSVGQNTLGDVNNSRGFDFNIFASELFSRIDVHKSTSANMREGGIGGTVSLFSAKPFDTEGFRGALGVEAAQNIDTDKTNPRISGLISNTWGDEFGALVSVAYQERSIQEHAFSTVRFTPNSWSEENMGADLDPDIADKFLAGDELWIPRGSRQTMYGIETERLGVTSALQWRPRDDFEVTLDGMYAKQDSVRNEYHFGTGNLWSGGATGVVVTDATIDSRSPRIETASFSGVTSSAEGRRDPISNEFSQLVLSATYDLSDDIEINGFIGKQDSEFAQEQVGINFDTDTSVVTNPGVDIDFTRSDSVATLQWNYDITDPNNFLLSRFRVRNWQKDIENNSGEINIVIKGDDIDLRAGFSYNDFGYSSRERRSDSVPISQLNDNVASLGLGQILPFDWGATLTGSEVGASRLRYITSDVLADTRRLGLEGFVADPRFSANYDIAEKATGFYGQLDFNSQLGEIPVRGNFGFRYVATEVSANGLINDPNGSVIDPNDNTFSPVSGGNNYTHILPSMNVVVEPSEDLLVRLGVSRNLTRPGLSNLQLNGSYSVNDQSNEVSVTSGNPKLQPLTTDNLDLSFEWYFSDDSLFSVALFYKQLAGFSSTKEEEVPFSETGLNLPIAPDQTVSWSRAVNDDESTEIQGMEMIYQQDLSALLFEGIGIITNVTLTDSQRDYVTDLGTFEGNIIGLSSRSWNGTLYYENDNWGARISANYRSDYIASGDTYRGVWPFSGVTETTFVDFNAFYNVTDDISITFEALNLSNEAFDFNTSSHGWPYTYTRSGTTLLLGARWTF